MRTAEHRIGILGLVGEAGTVPDPVEPETPDDEAELRGDWGVSTLGPNGTTTVTPGNGPIRWTDRSGRFRARLRIADGRALIELDGALAADTSWPLYAAVGSAISHRVRAVVVDARTIRVDADGWACFRAVRRTADRFGAGVEIVHRAPTAA